MTREEVRGKEGEVNKVRGCLVMKWASVRQLLLTVAKGVWKICHKDTRYGKGGERGREKEGVNERKGDRARERERDIE